jgi:hypothetical protein
MMHVAQLRRGDRGKTLENILNNESGIEKIVFYGSCVAWHVISAQAPPWEALAAFQSPAAILRKIGLQTKHE